MRTVSNFLPFQWTFGFPITALIGKLSTQQLLGGLGAQVLWIVIGSLSVAGMWKISIRHFQRWGIEPMRSVCASPGFTSAWRP